MASPEFQAWQARAAQLPAPDPAMTLAQKRAGMDARMGALPLAPGTSARDVDAGGTRCVLVSPDGATDDGAWVVYLHGGGYRLGSALSYRAYGSHLACTTGAQVLLVDYRLAPENPFPAAVDDALAAYRFVLDRGVAAGCVVVAGDSAGGGLAPATVLAAREAGLPLAAGIVCLSPWVDLTNTSASFTDRRDSDRLFSKAAADEAASLYLSGGDPRNPLASPLFGNWAGMPPLLIQVGDTEVLLDDARRLAEVAAAAGVTVEHHVYPEMPHVWQISYPAFPEAVTAVDQIAGFVRRVTAATA